MEVARSVEAQSVTGRVKWYDATKGFGFIESPALQGDVMIHWSKLPDPSNNKRLPEGAILEFEYFHGERGWQVERVISIDLSRAVDLPTRRKPAASAQEYLTKAGEFERCTVKWFHHERGFGFLVRQSDGQDVFVHAAALTVANLRNELAPGDEIEARVATTAKGLTAPCVRRAQ